MDAIAADEHGEMPYVSIPKAQIKFVQDIRKQINERKPDKNWQKKRSKLIVVLTGGCPVILNEIKEAADALVYSWYPGEEGGNALADMIFGKYSPSGHTPMTFIKSVDQLPAFNSYSMKGKTYRYMHDEPLYPFGYGLSYSTFDYSNLEMKPVIKAADSAKATFSNLSVDFRLTVV
jgi:beta-glucosidase